jgi:phosphohistidine phosphatase
MKLYIVRHAIAAPHGTPGVDEDERPLTKEGITKMQQASAGLRALGFTTDLIMTSPLLRARQTADILLKAFGKGVCLEVLPALAPSGSREDLYDALRLYEKKFDSLMLVGHQPSLGEIAGEIAFGSASHPIELRKGGACALDLESLKGTPQGNLIALLTPSILRRIVV